MEPAVSWDAATRMHSTPQLFVVRVRACLEAFRYGDEDTIAGELLDLGEEALRLSETMQRRARAREEQEHPERKRRERPKVETRG